MAEIPDDIREKARATADDIRQRFPHDHAEIIARAILAERERGAQIAEADARDYAAYRDHWPLRDACARIASAIRKGE